MSWGITENVEFPADYPYARVLDEIAAAGYSGTELGPYGFLPSEASALSRELAQRKLALCSAFVAIPLGNVAAHAEGLAHVRRSAKLIRDAGARLLVLSDEITPERSAVAGRRGEANARAWSAQEWQAATSAIKQAIEACQAVGLRVAFHHHAGTHVETPEEVARLLGLSPAGELGLCLDTGHYVYAGGDAVQLLEQQGPRVWCVHLKDVNAARAHEARAARMDFHAAVRHGIFAPLGKGSVDFPRVVTALQKHNFEGWAVVEADVLAGGVGADAPLAGAVAGREYLRRLGV